LDTAAFGVAFVFGFDLVFLDLDFFAFAIVVP
jgi:hypothetical protein